MMKRNHALLAACLCAALFVLSACSAALPSAPSASPEPTASPAPTADASAYSKYSIAYFDTFDTVITFSGYARTQEEFDAAAALLHERYLELHRLFDNYTPYEGVNNVYVLNQRAASEPVAVDPQLFDLLTLCKEQQPALHGQVNIALGSVLEIWHTYREAGLNDPENAQLPPMDALLEANSHTNFDDVVLDAQSMTVAYADPALKLDLGAVAKGYATELVAQELIASGFTSFVISAGGNIRTGSAPMDGRTAWGVGIQNPDLSSADELSEVLYLSNLSVVTSGNYQRYYVVDGKIYHHLIDPDTLMPSDYFPSVTIITEDSGLADLISTALFLMPYEEGRAFVDSLEDVEALWIFEDGSMEMTEGLQKYAKSKGATSR